MFKSMSRIFTVQPNFQGEEEEKSQKIFYWVLRDVYRTVWQLKEKERGVCQLKSFLSYFASAPFICTPRLLYNFCCNYSFSLSLSLSSLSPIWHPVFSQPLIFSCNPMLSCSVWTLTPGLGPQLSECSLVTLQRNSCLCTSPLPYPSAKILLFSRKMAGANTLASHPCVVDSLAYYARTDHRVLCKGQRGVSLNDYTLVPSARISISSAGFLLLTQLAPSSADCKQRCRWM